MGVSDDFCFLGLDVAVIYSERAKAFLVIMRAKTMMIFNQLINQILLLASREI